MAGAKREPSSLVQLTTRSGASVSMPGVVQAAHHLQPGQHAEDAVELAAGRLRVEVRAERDRLAAHVAAGPQGELGAERVDRHREPRRRAGVPEPVAHVPILGRERQAVDAAGGRAAEGGGLHDGRPQPRAVGAQVVGLAQVHLGHAGSFDGATPWDGWAVAGYRGLKNTVGSKTADSNVDADGLATPVRPRFVTPGGAGSDWRAAARRHPPPARRRSRRARWPRCC